MSDYTTADIKRLREESGAGVMDAQKALATAKGDYQKALKLVQAKGLARAEKKADRETNEGYIASYIHTNGRIGVMVELLCETDFVGRNDQFRQLGKNIAMQVASMKAKDVKELLDQPFIRDESATIGHLVKSLSGKIGENLVVKRFVRYEIGEIDEANK